MPERIMDKSEFPSFHAHVYFDARTLEKARVICMRCSETFGIKMGRLHERPVGPHPDWSCQLTVPAEKVGPVLTWLAMNRDGLVVFSHPNTENALVDHRDRAVWMGAIRPLDLSALD